MISLCFPGRAPLQASHCISGVSSWLGDLYFLVEQAVDLIVAQSNPQMLLKFKAKGLD